MAVHIRLKRIGKNPKKRPYFRIAVFDAQKARDGRSVEEIGSYNPLTKVIKLNQERFDYWTKNGAQPTEAVKKLAKKIKKEVRNATGTSS
ncbi:MAG: 30S ribosomal protein S16 [Candidatus Omnitrophica bacterium]|nr:30S ribosomal protein S16 [Candidatus Omnitrophota bacterium]MBU4345893.1 30S ribosomal protein S16 [Candidatus Omnitrophota bacterium]MBU4473050.1 30S ribosomal protein S16 [Candidatus Omnitrophota bacterium]MCG2706659.1 30S ribosomal protein S16 [Candidatus Omnitrophota bacterium]